MGQRLEGWPPRDPSALVSSEAGLHSREGGGPRVSPHPGTLGRGWGRQTVLSSTGAEPGV